MANKKRDYQNEYPSVTTVLGILRKIGLEMWFKFTPIKQIQEESERGRLIGTEIHEAIQSYIETGKAELQTQYAEEVKTALQGFIAFKKDHPEYIFKRSEIALTSEVYGFNGTLDCLAEKDGLLIADWKTGNAKKKDLPDIYDEYVYQVAAYVYLYNEINKTNINRAFILSLAKDKAAYNYREIGEVEIKGAFEEVFLPALKIYNYQKREKANGIQK